MRRYGRARRKAFDCNHRGFGEHCHRCALATELELAATGRGQVPMLAVNAHWGPQRMTDEANRLRRAPTRNWQPPTQG